MDLSKAFDKVKRPLLWKILQERAKTDEEKKLVQLIIKMYTTNTIKVGKKHKFVANRGVP